MSISFRRTLIAAFAAVTAAAAAAPAGAAAGSFNCAASAIRGSFLGQPVIEPVAANLGGAECRPETGSFNGLPAPFGASAATAQTDRQGPADRVAGQEATAVASIADFAIGGLRGLPVQLPAAQIPAGLDALTVPLSPTLQLLGLPSSIVVNALPAAQRLVPARLLPDLDVLNVGLARSGAKASCVDGAPRLVGASAIEGLRVLGQDLPVDGVTDRLMPVLPAEVISLAGLDPSAVELPAGLSFDLPVVGPLLEQAVGAVLGGLPPIQLPGGVAEVQASPQERSEEGGVLSHRALHVRVAVLGKEIADVVLGESRVAGTDVDCSEPAPVAPASQLAVSCSKRKVTLVSVIQRKHHVSLLGAAEGSLVGRTVDIVFTATGKRVATGVVRPDGFFRARAPLPARAIRHTNLARYQAVIDGQRSLRLKLSRRMHISRLRHRGNRVVIVGKVKGPFAAERPQIVIRRRVSCTRDVIVKRITPGSDGRWKVSLPAPPDEQAAVYRATTQVLGGEIRPKAFPTFTLPGYVSL